MRLVAFLLALVSLALVVPAAAAQQDNYECQLWSATFGYYTCIAPESQNQAYKAVLAVGSDAGTNTSEVVSSGFLSWASNTIGVYIPYNAVDSLESPISYGATCAGATCVLQVELFETTTATVVSCTDEGTRYYCPFAGLSSGNVLINISLQLTGSTALGAYRLAPPVLRSVSPPLPTITNTATPAPTSSPTPTPSPECSTDWQFSGSGVWSIPAITSGVHFADCGQLIGGVNYHVGPGVNIPGPVQESSDFFTMSDIPGGSVPSQAACDSANAPLVCEDYIAKAYLIPYDYVAGDLVPDGSPSSDTNILLRYRVDGGSWVALGSYSSSSYLPETSVPVPWESEIDFQLIVSGSGSGGWYVAVVLEPVLEPADCSGLPSNTLLIDGCFDQGHTYWPKTQVLGSENSITWRDETDSDMLFQGPSVGSPWLHNTDIRQRVTVNVPGGSASGIEIFFNLTRPTGESPLVMSILKPDGSNFCSSIGNWTRSGYDVARMCYATLTAGSHDVDIIFQAPGTSTAYTSPGYLDDVGLVLKCGGSYVDYGGSSCATALTPTAIPPTPTLPSAGANCVSLPRVSGGDGYWYAQFPSSWPTTNGGLRAVGSFVGWQYRVQPNPTSNFWGPTFRVLDGSGTQTYTAGVAYAWNTIANSGSFIEFRDNRSYNWYVQMCQNTGSLPPTPTPTPTSTASATPTLAGILQTATAVGSVTPSVTPTRTPTAGVGTPSATPCWLCSPTPTPVGGVVIPTPALPGFPELPEFSIPELQLPELPTFEDFGRSERMTELQQEIGDKFPFGLFGDFLEKVDTGSPEMSMLTIPVPNLAPPDGGGEMGIQSTGGVGLVAQYVDIDLEPVGQFSRPLSSWMWGVWLLVYAHGRILAVLGISARGGMPSQAVDNGSSGKTKKWNSHV